MEDIYTRTVALIGEEKLNILRNSHVLVVGIGGVGSFAAEAVVRAGVGSVTIIDNDTVNESNLNRQLIALHSTLNESKTSVMKKRMLDINPEAEIVEKNIFFDENTELDFSKFDYILDCIDSVRSKVHLIKCAKENNVPIISAMGTGNKIRPELLEIADIKDTSYCPLARAVRTRLKKEGIYELMTVFSKEIPKKSEGKPASISFVPSTAGLLMASYAIREMIK